jgi:hypothetical protein
MGIDIRIPIGLLFSIFGLMLSAFGLFGDRGIYTKSLDMNINFWWGVVMVLFGFLMLALSYFGRVATSHREVDDSSATAGNDS